MIVGSAHQKHYSHVRFVGVSQKNPPYKGKIKPTATLS
jgi:hypothetical protein